MSLVLRCDRQMDQNSAKDGNSGSDSWNELISYECIASAMARCTGANTI